MSLLDKITPSSGNTSCSSPPKPCRIGDHEFDPKRVHYGNFAREQTFSNTFKIFETYWHECRVCGSTCDHHDRTIGKVKVTDDGLKIVSGGVDDE